MPLSFEVQVNNLEQVRSDLSLLTGLWQIRTRDVLESWGKELVDIAFDLSPTDKLRGVDPRRRPESEAFKNFWEFEIHQGTGEARLDVGNTDERMPLIVGPTSAREGVKAKTADYLVFYWLGVGWISAWEINKPATPGQPVHEWTIDQFDIDQRLSELGNRLVGR